MHRLCACIKLNIIFEKEKWLKKYKIKFSCEEEEVLKTSSSSQDLLFFLNPKLLKYSQKINKKIMNFYLFKS